MLAATLALAVAAPAPAFEYSFADGEVTGYLDTTLSVGSLWRTQGRNPGLIAIANGGTSRDPNADDGNLNYDKGDLVSLALNATVDFLLKYRDFGVFARGSYLYDKAKIDKAELGPKAIDHTANYARLLDVYAFGKFDFAGRSLFVRAGDQVVNWGESTFIRNGISILNPVDVAKLRTPGVELKEVLSPTPMLWALQEVTDQLVGRRDVDGAVGRAFSGHAGQTRTARHVLQHR